MLYQLHGLAEWWVFWRTYLASLEQYTRNHDHCLPRRDAAAAQRQDAPHHYSGYHDGLRANRQWGVPEELRVGGQGEILGLDLHRPRVRRNRSRERQQHRRHEYSLRSWCVDECDWNDHPIPGVGDGYLQPESRNFRFLPGQRIR